MCRTVQYVCRDRKGNPYALDARYKSDRVIVDVFHLSESRKMQTWNERARAAMAEKGIKIRELADTLGMSPGGAGHYLSGRRHPNPGMLRKIAKRIGISVSELVEDDPIFARDQIEHDVLEAVRQIPAEQKNAALAMLRGLSKRQDDQIPTSGNY